jgi:hypothetical protein
MARRNTDAKGVSGRWLDRDIRRDRFYRVFGWLKAMSVVHERDVLSHAVRRSKKALG